MEPGEWISIRDALPGLHEKVLFTPMCNEGAIYIGILNAVGERGAAYFAVNHGRRKNMLFRNTLDAIAGITE